MTERLGLGCLAAGGLVLLALGCGSEPPPSLGGDTHWLAACDAQSQCARGKCICGVCSELCEGDGRCGGGIAAGCYRLDSPGVVQNCPSGLPAEAAGTAGDAMGICLAECEQASDCGAGQRCLAGACVSTGEATDPTGSGGAGAGASAGAGGGASPPKTRPEDFSDLQPMVSFDTPVALPASVRAIEGPAETLLGTWRRDGCDENAVISEDACLRIEIRRSADSGEIGGTLFWDAGPGSAPVRQFAPVVDPNVGYPVELTPDRYIVDVYNPVPGDARSLFNARFDGRMLTFWISPLELWADWCEQQTSYAVPGGDPPYRCVPEGPPEQQPPIDLGKYALCTSQLSGGLCEENEEQIACYCGQDQGLQRNQVLCTPAMCRCDAAGCAANLLEMRLDAELAVEGEQMRVVQWWIYGGPMPSSRLPEVTFTREARP